MDPSRFEWAPDDEIEVSLLADREPADGRAAPVPEDETEEGTEDESEEDE